MIANLSSKLISHLEEIEISAWKQFYDIADGEFATKLGISAEITDGLLVSRVSSCDVLGFNRVIGVGLGGQLAGEKIEEIISSYRKSRINRFFIQTVPDLADQSTLSNLRSCGLFHYNNWIKLYRRLSHLEGIRTDLQIRKIDTDYALEFAQVVNSCFDWPPDFNTWIAALVGQPHWHHYGAFDGERLVATGAFYIQTKTIWIDFASTLEDYRGRGAQSALLQRRFADAVQMGAELAVVETAQETADKKAPSYRNMIRYGFKEAYVRPNFMFCF